MISLNSTVAPKFPKPAVGPSGLTAYQERIRYEARLKLEFGLHEKLQVAGTKAESRAQVFRDFDAYLAGHPIAKAAPVTRPGYEPPPMLDGQPVVAPAADPIGDAIKLLEKSIEMLKGTLPADAAADDDGDEEQAKAALASGQKSLALAALSRRHSVLGARLSEHNDPRARAAAKLFANVRSEKPPRTRADFFANLRQGGSITAHPL